MRAAIAAFALVLLAGCSGGLGFDGHTYNMPDEIGSVRTVQYVDADGQAKRAKVHFWHAVDVMSKSPCRTYRASETYGCALWRTSDMTNEDTIALLDGHDCTVWTPPSRSAFDHEMRHCREGDWHL